MGETKEAKAFCKDEFTHTSKTKDEISGIVRNWSWLVEKERGAGEAALQRLLHDERRRAYLHAAEEATRRRDNLRGSGIEGEIAGVVVLADMARWLRALAGEP